MSDGYEGQTKSIEVRDDEVSILNFILCFPIPPVADVNDSYEDYEGSPAEQFRVISSDGDKVWGIELIDGMWYYDENFRKHPEHKKEVEELLKKRKAGDSSGVP